MLKCGSCAISRSIRQWHCVCFQPWNGCNLHADSGFLCQSRPRAPKRKGPFLMPNPHFQSNDRIGDLNFSCKRRSAPTHPSPLQRSSNPGPASSSSPRPPPASLGASLQTARPPGSSHSSGSLSRHSHKRKRSQHHVQADAVAAVASIARRRAQPLSLEQFLPRSS